MDVDSYVAAHGSEWERLRAATAGGSRDLMRKSGEEIEQIVSLYLRVAGHLAEVRTRYHDPRLEEYLNHIVSRAHGAVYSGQPQSFRSMVAVFGARYREALRRTVPFIVVSAIVLAVVTLASALWVAGSREAEAGLIPPALRGAIREANGPALRDVSAAALSTQIMVNNVQVSLLAFATGTLLCVPTFWILAQNAVLLGSLAGAYGAAGRSGFFWSLILPHGILELLAICIAAGAGMRIGWAVIDPGERARGVAVVAEARDAVMVVTGVVPAFVIAAMIEGFLTPSSIPGAAKIAVGAAVAAGYVAFLALPGRRAPVTGGRVPSRSSTGRPALR